LVGGERLETRLEATAQEELEEDAVELQGDARHGGLMIATVKMG
jgi:hypothetical protein